MEFHSELLRISLLKTQLMGERIYSVKKYPFPSRDNAKNTPLQTDFGFFEGGYLKVFDDPTLKGGVS